jgi:hypothetical protein
MGGTGVALHLLQHRVAQRALGQHALDRLLEDAAGEALLQLGEVGFVDAARVAGVAVVLLVLALLPVTRSLSTLTTTMKSPVSTCGV